MKNMNPTFVRVSIPSNIIDEDSPNFPVPADKGEVSLLINIKKGCVVNWLSEYGAADLWCKVVDEGTYIIYDEDGDELDRIEGYVPNKLIPEHDGYGDYIDMHINKNGYIKNWYNKPSLEDFSVDFDEIIREFEDEH